MRQLDLQLAMSDAPGKAGGLKKHEPLKAAMDHRWCKSSKAASAAGQKTLKTEPPMPRQTLMCDVPVRNESIADPAQT